MTTSPRAPAGLGRRGRAFWRTITTDYELTTAELELLAEASRTLDYLDELDAEVRRLGPTTSGSAGQTVTNPALTEARGQRVVLHRLIAALALPDEDGATIRSARQVRSATANNARWRGHVREVG